MTLETSPARTGVADASPIPTTRRTGLIVALPVALLALVMLASFLNTARQGLLVPSFLLLVVAVGVALAARAVPRPRVGAVELAMVAYLAWVLLSLVITHRYEAVDPTNGDDLTLSQSILRGVLLPFGVYLAARVLLREPRYLRWLLWTVVALTAYSAWVGIMQFHGPRALVWPRYIVDAPSWPGRAVGVFDQPVTNGVLLAVGIAVCLLLAERPAVARPARVGLYAVAAASTYTIYLTHTRAAVIGLVVVAVLGAVFARGWRRGFVVAGVLGTVALLSKGASTVFSPDRAAGGFGSPDEVVDRLNLVATALQAVNEHPWIGVGLGRFAMFNYYQHTAWSSGVDWSRGQVNVAHETELGVAAELGLPGLALWVAVLVAIAVLLRRAARRLPAGELTGRPLVLVAAIALVVMVVTGTTVDLRLLEFATMLPFLLAGAAVASLDRSPPERRSTSPGTWLAVAPSGRSGRTARWALVVGALLVAVSYVLGVLTPAGRAVDDGIDRLVEAPNYALRIFVRGVLEYGAVPLAVLLLALVVAAHLRAGDRRAALHAVVVILASELVTQAVKLLLPGFDGENTLPSGHMTFLAAVAVVTVTAIPREPRRRWRATAGVIAVLLLAAADGTWVIGWHRPSDVVAALGVVAACWGASTLLLRPSAPAAPDRRATASSGPLAPPRPAGG